MDLDSLRAVDGDDPTDMLVGKILKEAPRLNHLLSEPEDRAVPVSEWSGSFLIPKFAGFDTQAHGSTQQPQS